TQTISSGIAGWDVSFLFPLLRRTGAPGFDARALLLWKFAAIGLVVAGALSRRRVRDAHVSYSIAAGGCVLALVVVGWIAIAAGGPLRELRLLKTPEQSLRECRIACTGEAPVLQIGAIPPP